ncbi:MAG: hypothetical protein ACJ768_07495 [Gaiellaceae bacterium]
MQRQAGIFIGVVCAVMASTGTALAQLPAGDAAHDFAVGTAKNNLAEFSQAPVQLEVSAHRESATVVTGHVRGYGDLNGDLAGGDFNVVGHVTCLRVDPKPDAAVTGPGARASIKYVVDNSSGPLAPPIGSVVEVFVEDNGPPRGGTPVDANATLLPEPPELSDARQCDDPLLGEPYNPVDQGDYVVNDALDQP